MKTCAAILEVMWDWRSMTSDAGYVQEAPRWYRINPDNFTGRRLYNWIGEKGKHYKDLKVTNACRELVTSASGKGSPDAEWLKENLRVMAPFNTVLVCGGVANSTFSRDMVGSVRVVSLPHPAARIWTKEMLNRIGELVQTGTRDAVVVFQGGELIIREKVSLFDA